MQRSHVFVAIEKHCTLMILEDGIIIRADNMYAQVETMKTSACESCSSKSSCMTSENLKNMIITVDNTLHVEKGDYVIVGLKTGSFILLSFILYVLPIILLIIGALIGNIISPYFIIDASLMSMITGGLFFGLCFYILKKNNKLFESKKEYKPFLVRKKYKASSSQTL